MEKGNTIWLTGISGAGKTTIAKKLKEKYLPYSVIIDGDELRVVVNNDLGFSEKDRTQNISRAAYICQLLNNQGFDVIATLTSPLDFQRVLAKDIIGENSFFLCYVSCSVNCAIERDTKGLYGKFLKGEIKNMVGLDIPYEVPLDAKLVANTEFFSLEESSETIYKSFCNYFLSKIA